MHPDMDEYQLEELKPRFHKVSVYKPKESRKGALVPVLTMNAHPGVQNPVRHIGSAWASRDRPGPEVLDTTRTSEMQIVHVSLRVVLFTSGSPTSQPPSALLLDPTSLPLAHNGVYCLGFGVPSLTLSH